MLGVGRFIERFEKPIQAEIALMHHFASKQKALYAWDRRYAHMQFVIKWAPVFRRHIQRTSPPPHDARDPLAA